MADLQLRASWDIYRRWTGGIWTVALVLVSSGVIVAVQARHDEHPLRSVAGVVGFLAVLIALVAGVAVLVIRSARLTVTDGVLVHRRPGRRTTLRLTDEVSGLYAPMVSANGDGGTSTVDMLILVGPGGRPRVRLNGGIWDAADLRTVAELVDATVDRTPRDSGQWERDLPGSMGFVARRPVATAFLVVAGLFALIGGAVAIGVLVSR